MINHTPATAPPPPHTKLLEKGTFSSFESEGVGSNLIFLHGLVGQTKSQEAVQHRKQEDCSGGSEFLEPYPSSLLLLKYLFGCAGWGLFSAHEIFSLCGGMHDL